MQLTDAQLRFFNTFGYLGFKQVFNPVEVKNIIDDFEESIRKFGGQAHDGSKRTMFFCPIEHLPRMNTLLDDPRVNGILSSILGEEFNYCNGDGNYYSGDTGWHPDGTWGKLFAVKLAFYLDPVTKDTGCLRQYIPGSHDPGHLLHRTLKDWKTPFHPNNSMALYGIPPRDYPGNVPLETNPGDLLIFNHDTWHAAFGGGHRRRMFTMNCTKHAHTPEDLVIMRKYLSIHTPGGYKFDTGSGMYFSTMIDTASEARWKHLQQPAEIHDELFPQYARNAVREKTPVHV